MEVRIRPRQRMPQVLRIFTPTRLQDDLLAGVYDRLLARGASVGRVQDEPKEPRHPSVSATHGPQAATGG